MVPNLVFSVSPFSPPETGQVLREQAEVHESPERLPVEPGGDQRSGGKVLHPRRL